MANNQEYSGVVDIHSMRSFFGALAPAIGVPRSVVFEGLDIYIRAILRGVPPSSIPRHSAIIVVSEEPKALDNLPPMSAEQVGVLDFPRPLDHLADLHALLLAVVNGVHPDSFRKCQASTVNKTKDLLHRADLLTRTARGSIVQGVQENMVHRPRGQRTRAAVAVNPDLLATYREVGAYDVWGRRPRGPRTAPFFTIFLESPVTGEIVVVQEDACYAVQGTRREDRLGGGVLCHAVVDVLLEFGGQGSAATTAVFGMAVDRHACKEACSRCLRREEGRPGGEV